MKVIDVLNKLAKGEEIQDFRVGGNIIYKYRIIDNSLYRSSFDEEFEEIQWYIFKGWLNREVYFISNILDKEEKEYLSHVIKPFRDNICYIKKSQKYGKTFIHIGLKNNDYMNFPNLKNKNMYKGMNPNKHYTLKELGL